MIEKLLIVLAIWIINVIESTGYGGIVLLMAIESACIPLPSEIIMPFSGYLVFQGTFQLWKVAISGAIGCVLGSIVAYYAGAYGGRPLIEKYGRWLLISPRDLQLADQWFSHHGDSIVFISRLLPAVRTFIAFPAGVARMPMCRFIVYTFAGSYIWCWALAWLGMKMGENWATLGIYFHQFHYVIAITFGLLVVWYIQRHVRNS